MKKWTIGILLLVFADLFIAGSLSVLAGCMHSEAENASKVTAAEQAVTAKQQEHEAERLKAAAIDDRAGVAVAEAKLARDAEFKAMIAGIVEGIKQANVPRPKSAIEDAFTGGTGPYAAIAGLLGGLVTWWYKQRQVNQRGEDLDELIAALIKAGYNPAAAPAVLAAARSADVFPDTRAKLNGVGQPSPVAVIPGTA